MGCYWKNLQQNNSVLISVFVLPRNNDDKSIGDKHAHLKPFEYFYVHCDKNSPVIKYFKIKKIIIYIYI